MKDPATLRAYAADIRRLAVGKIDWADREDTIKRYAGVPENLASQRRSAENSLKGAALFDHYAQILSDREKAA